MASVAPSFSKRQQQLWKLLSQGKSNKEIAFELNITEGSVKQQLFTLYRKLGVTSRTKAVIRAAELMGNAPPGAGAPASNRAADKTYLWKLLTTVAIQPLKTPGRQPAAIIAFDRALARLRTHVEYLAALLDGHLLLAPGGGLLACFGTPLSHLDDPARALFFARMIAQWNQRHGVPELEIGIGVATAAEIVAESGAPPFHAESFKLAQRLASDCQNGKILATSICCRLAGPLYPYLPAPDQSFPSAISARLLPAEQTLDPARLAKRNPLPFITEVIARFRQKRQADWIGIESWPPSAGVRLMDAVAAHFEAAHLPTLRLRLPTARSLSGLAGNVAAQIEALANASPAGAPPGTFSGRSPLAALQALALHGPCTVLVYGVNSLDRIMELLELQGIQEIAHLPLLIIGMRTHEDASTYVAARLLGSNPATASNSRVFRLSLGGSPIAPNSLDADLLTLIDILSTPARQLVRQVAANGSMDYAATGIHARELLSSGLFIDQAGTIKCRDNETQNILFTHLVRDFKPA